MAKLIVSKTGNPLLQVKAEALGCDTSSAITAGATVIGESVYFRPTEAASRLLRDLHGVGDTDAFLMMIRTTPDLGGLSGELYPHQETGALFVLSVPGKGAILGDEVGMGKTITTFNILKRCEHTRKVVIVCLNAMVYTWKQEIEKWLPNMPVFVCTGDRPVRAQAIQSFKLTNVGTLVIGWNTLRHHPELTGIPIDWAIADDAFAMKNYKAKRTVSFLKLNADRRLGLAGTLPDKPQEMYPLLTLCNPVKYPPTAKGYWSYVERVCNRYVVPWKSTFHYDGLKNPEAFREEIAPYVLRRRKSEVLDLPTITYRDVPLTLSVEQRTAYNDMKEDMIAEYEGQVIDAAIALTMMIRLMQIASNLVNVFDVDLSVKSDAIVELRRFTNEKMVILTPWRKVALTLAARVKRAGRDPVCVVGGLSAEVKQAAIDAFQRGDADTFIATDQVAGSGLTLTAARILVWESVPWSRIRKPEGDARVHRISQDRPVHVLHMVAKDTVEERIVRRQRAGEAMRDKMFNALTVMKEEFGERLTYTDAVYD